MEVAEEAQRGLNGQLSFLGTDSHPLGKEETAAVNRIKAFSRTFVCLAANRLRRGEAKEKKKKAEDGSGNRQSHCLNLVLYVLLPELYIHRGRGGDWPWAKV